MRSPFLPVLAASLLAFAAACSGEKPAADEPADAPAGAAEEPAGEPGTEPDGLAETPLAGADESSGPTIEEMRAEALAQIDVEACEAGGGKVQQEGMLGIPRCVTPYKDAGKQCRDGDDCEGKCVGDDAVTEYNAPAGEMIGVCQANDSPFGCYAEIEDGSTAGMICVD